MEKEWIKRVREESKRKFEELLKKNMKVEGMYEIPEEYKDASKLHPVKASNHENKKMIKSIIDAENEVYKSMQLKDKLPHMSDEEILTLLSSDGMLVKRPLLILDEKIIIGFHEEEWKELL